MKSKRIAPPEFWRFVCILYVCFYHFEADVYDGVTVLSKGAYLGVDFFLMLSGYAVAYSNNRKPITSPLGYAFDKVKKIYPDFLFVILLMFLLWLIYDSTDMQSVFTHIYERRLQFFFVNAFVWTPFETGPLWFLSYWLVGMVVLIYVLKKKWLFVAGGLAISFMAWHYFYRGLLLDDPIIPQFLWSIRLIRCVFEVIIGAMAFEMTKRLEHVQLTAFGKVVWSVVEILIVSYVLVAMARSGRNLVDYYLLAGIFSIIILAFWKQTWLSNLLDNDFSIFLGKLSLPIYLYHPFVDKLAVIYLHNNPAKILAYVAYGVGVLVSAYMFHLFVERYFAMLLRTVWHKMYVKT